MSDLANSPRADVLAEATRLITGDRNVQYGPPTADFDRTAAMASAWGFEVGGQPLKGYHVALFMVILKLSRLRWSPNKRDSWTDAAGYIGCGYECAEAERARAERKRTVKGMAQIMLETMHRYGGKVRR